MLGARAILASTYIPNVSFFTKKLNVNFGTTINTSPIDGLYIQNTSTTLLPTIWFHRRVPTNSTTMSEYISYIQGNKSRNNDYITNYVSQYGTGIAINNNEQIYVTEGDGRRLISKIMTNKGFIDNTGYLPLIGTGVIGGSDGYSNGVGAAAQFSNPTGIDIDSNNNVYIVDTVNHVIRKMTPNYSGIDFESYSEGYIFSTLAGPHAYNSKAINNKKGCIDGARSTARFNSPRGICVDSDDNIYVADSGNHVIRKITPYGLALTIAGLSGTTGNTDGVGSAARFNNPLNLCCDFEGNIFVSDTGNRIIRKITKSLLPTSITRSYLDSTKIFTFSQVNTFYGFGASLSMNADGKVIIVGSPNHSTSTAGKTNTGCVYIYRFDEATSNWVGLQQIIGTSVEDRFGYSVSINADGSRIIIGSQLEEALNPTVNSAGSVRVYSLNSTTQQYTQTGQTITPRNAGEQFGSSVSMNSDGNIFAVGTGYTSTTNFTGSVRVYNWNTNTSQWSQMGQTLSGTGRNDTFGTEVSLNSSGNIVAANSTSGIRIYKWNENSSQWDQLGQTIFFDLVNIQLNSNGYRIVIGFFSVLDRERKFVRVFEFNQNTSQWIQLGSDIVAPDNIIRFGSTVRINGAGDKIAVGSPSSNNNAGSIIFFNWNSGTSQWVQLGRIDGELTSDQMGYAFEMDESGERLVANVQQAAASNDFNYRYVRGYEYKTITYTENYEYNVTTFAGSGDLGDSEGDYLVARFTHPKDIKMMNTGDLILIDGDTDPRLKRIKNPIAPITNFNITLSSNHYNLDLGMLLRKKGWNGTDSVNCTLTILSGVYLYAASHKSQIRTDYTKLVPYGGGTFPALLIKSDLNNSTITIINSGGIIGSGGRGKWTGATEHNGGDAILVKTNITLKNYGIIGGGGGGGGCIYTRDGFGNFTLQAAGGGGAGYLAGISPKGSFISPVPTGWTHATILSGGKGADRTNSPFNNSRFIGGTGGNLGEDGQQGTAIKAENDKSSKIYLMDLGTKAGAAINGISFVTIDPSSNGQIYGATV